MIFTASARKQLERTSYKEKASSVSCVNKGQHITDSVGIVHAAADYVVRPIFYNVANTLFLPSVSLIRGEDQMQNLKKKWDFLKLDKLCVCGNKAQVSFDF